MVVATGIIPFAFVPPELSALPSELVSHTSQHASLEGFRGKEVLVVGAGSSALETAALLHERGAAVKLVIRGDGLSWPTANTADPSRLQRFRKPVVRLCEGWPCWVYDRLPDLFRFLPEESRIDHALGFLGPQGAWWLRDRVEGTIPTLLGHQLLGAEAVGDRVQLQLQNSEGRHVTESADHVIAGTGFRLDLNRLDYISLSLRADLKLLAGAPRAGPPPGIQCARPLFHGCVGRAQLGASHAFRGGHTFHGPPRGPSASSKGTSGLIPGRTGLSNSRLPGRVTSGPQST